MNRNPLEFRMGYHHERLDNKLYNSKEWHGSPAHILNEIFPQQYMIDDVLEHQIRQTIHEAQEHKNS
jgi:hypothetical protein